MNGDDDTLPLRRGALQPLTGLRCLLVEDDEDSRELMHELLAASGALVTSAPCGDSALGLIQGGSFDVLLADVEMPGRDGLELVRLLRREAVALPAIAITGRAGDHHRDAALTAGFDHYLLKPVDLLDLIDAITLLVGRC